MIVIIDYGMGNVQSVKNALDFLGYEAVISRKESDIAKADRIIIPGVGAFIDGMKNIDKFGLRRILTAEVIDKKKPVLGICLGMQLLGKESDEGGHCEGLGWIDASVKMLDVKSRELKLPHVGWNNLVIRDRDDLLLKGIPDKTDFYFVHSFHVIPNDPVLATSTCDYGVEFVATIRKGNIHAVQFHPEKSQEMGLKILENFVENA